MMTGMGHDLRYALRQVRRSPGFAAAASLTLALGIAATTTVFSFVDAALLRPLPSPDASRLFVMWNARTVEEREYRDLRRDGVSRVPAPAPDRRPHGPRRASRDVLASVLWHSLRMAAPGVLLGLVGALISARVMRTFLYQVEPTDPLVLVLVCSGVAALVMVATLVPARRAAGTDPMTVLRSD
jgi:hypothetical protein